MYKFKNMVRRSAALTAAVSMLAGVGSAALPAIVHADALNPLTERSLMLSSSSPGWRYVDGSGNATFAPPGSGPNGQKTGETFSFRVSTDSSGAAADVKAFTLHYCTSPAGNCIAPGNVGTTVTTDPGYNTVSKQSALDVHYSSPAQGTDQTLANRGDFLVLTGETLAGATVNSGWSMATSRSVTSAGFNTTGNNFITLTNTSGGLDIAAGTKVWIIFFADGDDYITNPGSGAFFVKINDYSSATTLDDTTAIDGGVTVANVMNDSIWITTKVLETMAFSVGTSNPDTVELDDGEFHGTCDPITENDMISMGDPNAEFSLKPTEAFDAYSYWRLSTNSSAGATVYYSGDTLRNTVGDHIKSIAETNEANGTSADRPTNQKSHPGTEQFGLAVMNDYSFNHEDTTSDPLDTAHFPVGYSGPTLNPLTALTNVSLGDGTINSVDYNDNTAEFSFDENSLTTPVAIASDNDDVLVCATAKMRYVANIQASTPAGVYATRINYIAAPMY